MGNLLKQDFFLNLAKKTSVGGKKSFCISLNLSYKITIRAFTDYS